MTLAKRYALLGVNVKGRDIKDWVRKQNVLIVFIWESVSK